tara:strand:- start:67 stop:324 length:258 start_codon:yes stop_codon:yes gene_type:complete
MISNRTGHLTKEEVYERVKDRKDIVLFVEAFMKDDPILFQTIEDNIDKCCVHSWVEDEVDCGLEDIQQIKYCEICELDFSKWNGN